jgi:hypothetical protein
MGVSPRLLSSRRRAADKVSARSAKATLVSEPHADPGIASARIGAVSAKQAALIGLVGVLLSALLSVLAGVVSARIAGQEAARTTAVQLSGETERSRAEFLRGQRRVLYTRVVSHVRILDLKMDDYVHRLEINQVTMQQAMIYMRSKGPLGLGFHTLNVPGHEEMLTLDSDSAELAILGSSAVYNAYGALFEAENDRFNSISECTNSIKNGEQPKDDLTNAIFGDVSQIDAAMHKMLQAMKADLGAQ